MHVAERDPLAISAAAPFERGEDLFRHAHVLLVVELFFRHLPLAITGQAAERHQADILLGEVITPFDEGDAILQVGVVLEALIQIKQHPLIFDFLQTENRRFDLADDFLDAGFQSQSSRDGAFIFFARSA